jgi:phospholipid/cholesterol/gamma-HCH transport system substrate-binding protein
MSESAVETAIGAVVLAVAAGFIVYASQFADISGGGSYELTANFRKAEGLGVGGDVRISGVKVGAVRAMGLDPETFEARVTLAIENGVMIPEDSAATIASDGLLGGAHVAIQPGGAEFTIEPGGQITITQSSISILDLIGRAISGGSE